MRSRAGRSPGWWAAMGVAVALLFLLSSYAPGASQAALAEGPVVIAIKDSFYEPGDTTVIAGTTVTWVNQGSARHTVTGVNRYDSSGSGGIEKLWDSDDLDELWDSDDLKAGQSYTMRFDTPGTYLYLCERHDD
ncbi:MAG TPA: cupredoxin domain-containing protein [Dehalococcoidia bacterium]|nr:cupredoxin domain-containing protein [Dehalococcoidia bacterium]